jgi:hypothetical protein
VPFLKSSRYANVELVQAPAPGGRVVAAVKLRRLADPASGVHLVDDLDRIDSLADRAYGDATRGWHIADANTELDARALARSRRTINKPEAP